MAKKDGDPKKIKKSELDKYKSEGYKFKTPGKSETGVSQEYYELPGKRRPTPPSILPGSDTPGKKIPVDPKKYEGDIIKMIEDGYDPRELPPSILHPSRVPDFIKYYKPKVVYTEPEPTTVSPIPLQRGLVLDRKDISGENPNYKTYQYPDPNAGYSKATTKYFVGDEEIDPTKSYDATGKFTPSYLNTQRLNEGTNLGSQKLNVPTQSTLPLGTEQTDETGVPIKAGAKKYLGTGSIGFKKGGLINKIKGYVDGGDVNVKKPLVDAGTAGSISSIGGAVTPLINAGGNKITEKGYREDGTQDTSSAAWGGAMRGGAAVAPLALNPTLLSATGGLSAGLIPIAGFTNAIIANKDAKEANAEIKSAKAQSELDERNRIAGIARQGILNKSMTERASYLGGANYKKGGIVKKFVGGGMVEGGASAGELAAMDANWNGGTYDNYSEEQINKNVVGGGASGGSPMFKKGGLINKIKGYYEGGELTAYDYAKDPTKLPGYVADPNAMKPMAYAKSSPNEGSALYSSTPNSSLTRSDKRTIREYGLNPDMMTTDEAASVSKAYAHDNRYTDKERGGLTGGGGAKFSLPTASFKDGGKIEGKGTGTSDSIMAKVKAGSFITPAKNADEAKKVLEYVEGGKVPSTKKANLNQEDGEEVKLSDGEFMFTPKQKNKIINELGEEVLEELAPDAECPNCGKQGCKCGGKVGMKDGGMVDGYKGGTKPKGVPKTKEKAEKMETMDLRMPTREIDPDVLDLKIKETVTPSYVNNEIKTTPSERNGLTNSQITGLASEASGLINSLRSNQFSRNQINKARKFLAESGKRPVGSIDQGFQDVVNQANAAAKYGMSAEELAAANQQNVGLLNTEMGAARNFSGGSAANALANTRAAIDASFGRGIGTAVKSRQLQLDKQAQANILAAKKADMNRQLFEDTMNAWTTNQKSGAALLGAGLENQIGGQRYNEAMRQLAINKANENSYLNSFT